MGQITEVVPRVSRALKTFAGEPLIVLFGPGASDKFVGIDYRERSLEEALWQALRDIGYRNIVFTSSGTPAYCLDDDSRRFIGRQLGSLAPRRKRGANGGADAAVAASAG